PDVRRACAAYDPFDAWKDLYDEAESDDPLARAMYVDLRTYLADDILTKVDRASMAVSLEARVPILDHRLVEWTCRIPTALKLRDGKGKWIFRRALESRLPAEILRGRKHGFSVPLSRWMRDELAGPLDEAVASGAGGLLDPAFLAAARDAHAARRAERAELLYAALVLDRWRRRWN
ncbi:MAG TPA: asparagine synthase-related protein, partial [Planctomycetota bacterium]|nr:asparagine synthase-related protein [Planctomycetota bacterium]